MRTSTPSKATYIADIDGRAAADRREVGAFRRHARPDRLGRLCEWLQIHQIIPTTLHAPIYEDTVFTINLKRYQRLVSYLTYHDGSWHFDVYAANIGDVPQIPEGYDSPGESLEFTGWLGMEDGVTAVDYELGGYENIHV